MGTLFSELELTVSSCSGVERKARAVNWKGWRLPGPGEEMNELASKSQKTVVCGCVNMCVHVMFMSVLICVCLCV